MCIYFFQIIETEIARPDSGTAHVCEGVESTVSYETKEVIERLQREFRERVSRIRLSLTATISLTAIKDLLKELPAGEVKNQVGHLLSNNYSLIMSSDDIDQLFVHLSNMQAWDFLHPQLLEYLVQELADDEIKEIMTEYKSLLIQFRSKTKMSELSGWFGDISETSTFKKIVLSLGDNWKDKTYEEFEVLRVSLLHQRVFFQSSLHLCGILTDSILVALAIPDSIYEETMEQIRSSENSFLTFLVDNNISAVFGERFCLIRDARSELLFPGHPAAGRRHRPGNLVAGILGRLSRRGHPDNPPVVNPPTPELVINVPTNEVEDVTASLPVIIDEPDVDTTGSRPVVIDDPDIDATSSRSVVIDDPDIDATSSRSVVIDEIEPDLDATSSPPVVIDEPDNEPDVFAELIPLIYQP